MFKLIRATIKLCKIISSYKRINILITFLFLFLLCTNILYFFRKGTAYISIYVYLLSTSIFLL